MRPTAELRSPRELELKFEVTPEAAERLSAHPLLADRACETAVLEQVYFDTPGQDLRKKGFALRVRRSGDEFVQTLKRGIDAAGLFDREEWESPVTGLAPEPAALKRTPLGGKTGWVRKLRPIARLEVERSTWEIRRGNGRIELALDFGSVRSGRREAPILELELELKSGSSDLLFDLAGELGASLSLRLGKLSKAQRAYELASGRLDKVRKAPRPTLHAGMTVAQAFAAILLACLRHFRLNEALIGRNPEALHQARVAMRRLRAAFSLFGGVIRDPALAGLRAELRWFTDSLGDARNIDVFLKRHRADLKKHDRERLKAALSAAYEEVARAVYSGRLRKLLLGLLRWSETGEWREHRRASAPIRGFAAKALQKRWAKVRKNGSKLLELDPEQRHRFRIEVKKLRYAAEFLGSLFEGPDTRRFTRTLKAMQESLGDLNDRIITRQIASDLSLDWRGQEDLASEREEVEETAEHFARLETLGPFWSVPAKAKRSSASR